MSATSRVGIYAGLLLCSLARPSRAQRPAVFGLDSDKLAWQPWGVAHVPQGPLSKTLSRDPQSGAVSLLVYYPPGWHHEEQGYRSAAEEIFVLEGELAVGERKLGRRFYTYIPAGVLQGPRGTQNGCLALMFFDRDPDFLRAARSRPGSRPEDSVEPKNYFEENFQLNPFRTRTKEPPALLIKTLRRDPVSGAETLVAAVLAGRSDDQWEIQPTWMEGYLLEGHSSIHECLPQGSKTETYASGGYFFRPARTVHGGPIDGAKTYEIWLLRTPEMFDVQYFKDKACPQVQQLPPPVRKKY